MLQTDELRDDEGPSNTLTYFVEKEDVIKMIDSMKATDAVGFEKSYEQYTEVLSRYQEQPHLLDPHIDELLTIFFNKIRNKNIPETEMHAAFKYLYILCKVRTHKVIVKFLPHELSDLEYALDMLSRQDPKEHNNWETRYMLLLWMSILVLNPFHMARLDAYTTEGGDNQLADHEQKKSKMERIYDLCVLYTETNDTCSKISAFLASKYLIRFDIKDLYLERFLDHVIDYHQPDVMNVKYGQLAAVAAILKHGKREDLLPYAGKLLNWIVACQYKTSTDFLKYRSNIKIIQRIGLVYLKPRIASWRYKRGTRSLVTNLTQTDEPVVRQESVGDGSLTIEESDEDIVVPAEMEEVIEELLQGLSSDGSDVRWSAAKGLGRVTNRLPKELADDVIGSVIELLNPLQKHEAWHGACLALAELGKRGLLLPNRLEEIVPLLLEALFYDEMKGFMSVGQHIRDSACYMCWAFARAYNPDDFQPFVQRISAGLLTASVFDREINVRRAASAAFQESVGRLGNFPYGIEISTATDFYTVGSRQNAYLNLSDFIAQYAEYSRPLIDHLVVRKVNHWDSAIRELTAKALARLTARAPEYMAGEVLPKLFALTGSTEVNTRHGSVLAIGEIAVALKSLEQANVSYFSNQTISDLNDLLGKFWQRDLFRGMSGEMMKQCCTDFIRNCSSARIPVTSECLETWQEVIDKSIINKTNLIRESAASAFAELCKSYYDRPGREAANAEIVRFYLSGANNDLEEHIRMGYISALGSLSAFMLTPHLDDVLDSLVMHSLTPLQAVIAGDVKCEKENSQTYKWSEARRDSVKALSNLVQTVGYDGSNSFGNPKYFNRVVDCLLKAVDEYTIDNRGDIGAWVREAAMNALYQLLTTCPHGLLQPDHIHSIILAFMQQSVEKIDRTRGLAGRLVCNLIHAQPAIPHIKRHDQLKEIFPEDASTVLWLFADHTFPLFCKLLSYPEYSKRVLLGLIASIGQLTESLIKYSSAALFQYLRSHSEDVPRLCQEIIENFQENLLNERVTYPMLNFLDTLIGSGTIGNVLLDPSASFATQIYDLVNIEIKGHKKLYKLVSSINVYCQLVQVPQLCKKILSKMSVFLGLTHVHIRKSTATKLYEALALHGDVCDISEENLDEILNLLSETDWGLPLLEVRPIRNELCRLMGIKPPVSGAIPANANANA